MFFENTDDENDVLRFETIISFEHSRDINDNEEPFILRICEWIYKERKKRWNIILFYYQKLKI